MLRRTVIAVRQPAILSIRPLELRGVRAVSTGSSMTSSQETSSPISNPQKPAGDVNAPKAAEAKPKRKTMAELDEELRLKLEGISGDGGAAGLELEDGKPVAMKRSVKNNMFRLI